MMSPGFMAPTARAAGSPMQSSANLTGRLMMRATSAATGLRDCLGSRPFGRPTWESRTTLPPLSASSLIAGAARSIRVASVTTPFSTGTFRSTRSRMRLPFTSTRSSVRNSVIAAPERPSEQLAHRDGCIRHSVGEAPLVVVPGHHAHQRAVHDLGLVHVERGRVRVVIEVDRNVGIVRVGQDAFELLLRCPLYGVVDLFLGRLLLGDDLEIDDRYIRCRYADGNAIELALEFGKHETDGLGGAGRRGDHRHRSRACA